jgi:hypothetical protein
MKVSLLIAAQTSDDCFYNSLCIFGSTNWNRNHSCLFGWIVVSSRKQSVTDKDHLFQGNTKDVPELSNPIGLVDAGFSDIDRGRTAHSDRELRKECVKDALDLLPLGIIWIPFVLFFQGSLLAKSGICYLAAPVFNCLSPRLLRLETCCFNSLLEGTDDLLSFDRCEVFRINLLPVSGVAKELGSTRWK